jgi:hypothetical protein
MTLGSRRTLAAVILSVVVLAVIGLLYLEFIVQRNATREGWLVTQDVPAGATLDSSNVKHIRISASNDQFAILEQDPTNKHALRDLRSQTLLRSDDVASQETAQVPITLRASPNLQRGDVIDVFALYNGQTLIVGKRLVVISPSNPIVVEVQASSEQSWIALQANNTPLYASLSPGLSVGASGPVTQQDAISALTGLPIAGPGPR